MMVVTIRWHSGSGPMDMEWEKGIDQSYNVCVRVESIKRMEGFGLNGWHAMGAAEAVNYS